MARWTGTLAYLGAPSLDGRVLGMPEELRTRDLPLPLVLLGNAHTPTSPLGYVDSVTVVGNELHGTGRISDGFLRPGEKLPVGVDLDQVDVPEESDGPQVLTSWRLVAVTAYRNSLGEPAWPDVHIRLADA